MKHTPFQKYLIEQAKKLGVAGRSPSIRKGKVAVPPMRSGDGPVYPPDIPYYLQRPAWPAGEEGIDWWHTDQSPTPQPREKDRLDWHEIDNWDEYWDRREQEALDSHGVDNWDEFWDRGGRRPRGEN